LPIDGERTVRVDAGCKQLPAWGENRRVAGCNNAKRLAPARAGEVGENWRRRPRRCLRLEGGCFIFEVDLASQQIIFWSPVVVVGRGASTLWIWRVVQKVGESGIIIFATQRGRIFPHLVIGNCLIMGLYSPAAATRVARG
jgi:hypothetical protein